MIRTKENKMYCQVEKEKKSFSGFRLQISETNIKHSSQKKTKENLT
jgi:hypothetical protein